LVALLQFEEGMQDTFKELFEEGRFNVLEFLEKTGLDAKRFFKQEITVSIENAKRELEKCKDKLLSE